MVFHAGKSPIDAAKEKDHLKVVHFLTDSLHLSLDTRLPDKFEAKDHQLTGAIVLHSMAVHDFARLERRSDEIDDAILNATCSVDGDCKGVRQTPPLLVNTVLRSTLKFLHGHD